MKICLVNNLYRPYNRGGAETFVNNLRDGFFELGHQAFVVSSKPLFHFNIPSQGDYYLSSFYFYLKKIPYCFRLIYHVWDFVNFITPLKLFLIIKKEKPDLIISNNVKGLGFLSFFAVKYSRIKHIHILHDIQLVHPSGLLFWGQEKKIDTLRSRFYQRICIFYTKDIKNIISPSKWLCRFYQDRGFFKQAKVLIKPNPAPKINIKHSDDKSEYFNILYAGHVNKAKGIEVLMKALEKLGEKGFDKKIKLHIAGRYLDKSIKIRNGENYQVLGPKFYNKEGMEELLVKTNLLVVPSMCYENSPTVIYEAYYFGVEVIASRIGGISELVNLLGGDLFTPGNSSELSELIMKKIKNPLERININRNKLDNSKSYIKHFIDFFNIS